MQQDTVRHYFSAKMAKDFVMLADKLEFSMDDIEGYFEDKVFLNYINEMMVKQFDDLEYVITHQLNFSDLYYRDRVPVGFRVIPPFNKARRNAEFIEVDAFYFLFADQVLTNQSFLFKENLKNYEDFRNDFRHYRPILDREKFPVDYFRTLEEPHLISEMKADNLTAVSYRLVRGKFLGKVNKLWNHRLGSQELNNTNILRGFHITVRDAD
jgi:hypothetical protein